jgi:hypothetical protein
MSQLDTQHLDVRMQRVFKGITWSESTWEAQDRTLDAQLFPGIVQRKEQTTETKGIIGSCEEKQEEWGISKPN